MNVFYTYILTNKLRTVFYTGVTNNLPLRVYQHKYKIAEGFTKKYNVNILIYFEEYGKIIDAIAREKQIKDYRREKKLDLIKGKNPILEEIDVS